LKPAVWFHLQIRQSNLPKDTSTHLTGKAGKIAYYMYHPWGTFHIFHQLLITDAADELVRLTATLCARAG